MGLSSSGTVKVLALDTPAFQKTLGLTGQRKSPASLGLSNCLELESLMTNQLMVKTQRLVSLVSLEILLAVAPVVVGQSLLGPQQATGATPTYGPGSDNKPILKSGSSPGSPIIVNQEARPATKSDPARPSAAKAADASGDASETLASLRPAKLLRPGTFQLHVEKNE